MSSLFLPFSQNYWWNNGSQPLRGAECKSSAFGKSRRWATLCKAYGVPPSAFFKEWCYNFLGTGKIDLHSMCKEDVADLESRLLISRVSALWHCQIWIFSLLVNINCIFLHYLYSAHFRSKSPQMSSLLVMYADEIVSCRYTSQIKLGNKESIIR